MVSDWKILREDELRPIAHEIAAHCPERCFLALLGDLGAGKTTFVKYLASEWGIEDVRSPSYDILHVHNGERILIHIDAYRLQNGCLTDLNFDDLCKPPFCCAVEWPECLVDFRNFNLQLTFTVHDDGFRRIQLKNLVA
jgi:tRNA threonylcarbamoyladenosine biosynthesis protein TsaE